MITVVANTLGDAWIKTMGIIMNHGVEIRDENQILREICNLYVTIERIDDTDPVILKYADPDRIRLMQDKYATCGLVGDYKVDYGSRIFDNEGVNQLDWAAHRIMNKPETKSATISLHKPGEDMLPCLSLLDFKLRNDRLNMTAVYRSQNAFWSMPGNMLALRKMQKDVATQTNCNIGKVELVVASSHIYSHNYNTVKRILIDMQN